MVWFGNEQRSFCCFWDCTQVLHFSLFFDYEGYSVSSKGFLPTVVDIMVIWIEFTHSGPYLDSILKSRDVTLPIKVHLVKAAVFSSSRVWMWELDCKESWAPKSWCFWTVVLEKTLESPLDYKERKPVSPKGNVPNIHWKDWCWSWNSDTLATWCKELTHLKRPWC